MQTENRKSFIVYTDYTELINDLDNEETGELFRAILLYASGEAVPQFSGKHLALVFKLIKNQMDRDNEKYIEICRKRREASRKAVEARRNKADHTQPNGYQTLSNSPDNENVNENENENATGNETGTVNETELLNDNIIHTPPKSPSRGTARADYGQDKNFLDFWEVYPKKRSIQEAYRQWKRISPDDALSQEFISAVRCQLKDPQWQTDNGRYIPFPAHWLQSERWKDSDNVYQTETRDYSCILEAALNIGR